MNKHTVGEKELSDFLRSRRSNYDKPFYVDIGTSIAAIRCASNHDVIDRLDYNGKEHVIKIVMRTCDRMNQEFELYAKSKVESIEPTCDWSVKDALQYANTLLNHGWTRDANADAASSCIYALCRLLKDNVNAAAMRDALTKVSEWMAHRIATGGFEASPTFPTVLEDIVLPALAAPARNCDVGTADEQAERFGKFCKMDYISGDCPDDCPLYRKDYSTIHCPFIWAQMPYEEGGAE